MSRAAAFKQHDVTKLLRAARAAGWDKASVEFASGKIVMVVGDGEAATSEVAALDAWRASRGKS